MSMRALLAAPALGLLISLPALGTDDADGRDAAIAVTRSQDRVSLVQANQGLDEVRAGRYRDASRSFNAALKFEPENAHLHFLNGLSYHLLYTQGHQANRELAETAYTLALRFAPDHALAAYYLGLIHLDGRQYAKAQASFAHALLLERDDPSVLQALAVASYYARDIGMALWAIERVEQTQGVSADTLRAAAIIHAAAGRPEDAQKRSDRFRQIAGTDAGAQLDKRVRQWQSYHESNRGRLLRTASQTVPLSPEASYDTPTASAPAASPPAPMPVPATPDAKPAGANGDILRNWSDCPQSSTPATNPPSYDSLASSDNAPYRDETAQLPALPSPCDRKALPRMALLDTAIVSTMENISANKGINLLDGLRLMLGASFTDQRTTGGARTQSFTRTASLDNLGGTTVGLAYSLNIANAGSDWNQVLARPTLVALDRQPSTFFSGSSLSATVTGAYSSTLVEHPAGISLSVTPTFIDDETLLLSVRVARSFFAGSLDLQNDTIVKSRNAVSANVMMKMGETLILSGLTERQLNESKKGVPLLKDIPVLQYLFSTETNNDLTQSVLVMITPRLPVTGVNAPVANRDAAGDPRQQSSLKELREQIPATLRPTPNLDLVFLDMEDNRLFREFRSGDIRADDWRRPPRIERTLKQIVDFLYY